MSKIENNKVYVKAITSNTGITNDNFYEIVKVLVYRDDEHLVIVGNNGKLQTHHCSSFETK